MTPSDLKRAAASGTSTAGGRRTLILCAVLLLAACGPVEGPETPQDADDSTPTKANPRDPWLVVEEITPQGPGIATSPTLRIKFNDYLEDDSFASYDAASLSSGGLQDSGWAEYSMVDKAIVWQPRSSLEPALVYALSVNSDIVSVTGTSLLSRPVLALFQTDPHREPETNDDAPAPTWRDIRAIFEQHCTSCHGSDTWPKLNPLTYESLVGTRSTQTDTFLVRPYDAPDSYLMHKLLWDYPVRRYTPQPPPWSEGAEELPREELRAIERWIDAGAPR